MKKTISIITLVSLSIFMGAYSSLASAQSTVILGDNDNAKDCYEASIGASQGWGASFSDLENCDDALRIGQMRTRDVVATHVNRGIIYVALGKLDRAVEDYNRAIEVHSNFPEAYLNRGNLLFMTERYSEAITDYDKAIQLNLRQMHILYLNRGMAYELMGSFDSAEKDYLSALEIAPEWNMAAEKLEQVNKKQLEATSNS